MVMSAVPMDTSKWIEWPQKEPRTQLSNERAARISSKVQAIAQGMISAYEKADTIA